MYRIIEAPNSGKYPFSHSLLIGKSCIIDTGSGEALAPLRVDCVLNTHWHEDHIAMNSIGRKVLAHPLDAEAIESYEEFRRRYGIGDSVRLFINFEFGQVDDVFEDGEQLEFEGVSVEVIHTPGHSAGHCCFVINNEAVFLGDIDLTSFGPWYGCLDCDVDDFVRSVKKMMREVERRDIEIAIPSHGRPVYGKEEIIGAMREYLKKIFERDKAIRELVRLGVDPVGKGIIYRKIPEPREIYLHFEKIMVEKHLTTSLDEFCLD
ncbi:MULTISPECIES: MBL fold metallo-hydrolase [Archaeoglobus]|jgi:glyoxylase-like metal-dependent hydrolase (beta-lactamase superfamily II)|uniref:Metallo-beta-lactamase domain-containing protein n=3 Tax=Archaeoglobus fulgidus TaxID=2234 RepID=O28018_ARCFU|nr:MULTISPECIES: MBL fold metallo-hydrolase [Archaeoglobus]AAB88992.1 conserved hypothetical protein [Archaeoglobus fulgidus DSM 4304]AIG99275.1 Zn-dependent hydrolase [Archaeoglobus fulgidus DSM 8774]KUJ93274.1 MAG: hypothetical protein XD40_1548 [Archaeoglobus fulgidus]KUK06908.1 MAG: hypothetical protein XD48_0840 [Archaeoglobus fulgidus]MDI3497436.1 hypothetical protein [Archaeoglobus sp.]